MYVVCLSDLLFHHWSSLIASFVLNGIIISFFFMAGFISVYLNLLISIQSIKWTHLDFSPCLGCREQCWFWGLCIFLFIVSPSYSHTSQAPMKLDYHLYLIFRWGIKDINRCAIYVCVVILFFSVKFRVAQFRLTGYSLSLEAQGISTTG